MNEFLDFYTTYVSPVVYIILFIVIIITFFYLFKMVIHLKKLSLSVNSMSATSASIQEKIIKAQRTKDNMQKYYKQRISQMHFLLSSIFFLRFLKNNKGEN